MLKGKEKLVATPFEESFRKLLECARERAKYRDGTVVELVERTKDTLPSVLATNSSYHKSCYAAITNISKLERARKRYRDSIDSGEASLIKCKAGRPRLQVPQQQEEPLMTRSKSEKFDKKLCIICQIPTERNLTRAEREDTGKHMLVVSEKLSDKSFFRRLNSIPKADDAVADDVFYHGTCWIKVKREAAPKTVVTENFVKTLSDIELLKLIELIFNKASRDVDMNEINRIYKSILLENGMENEKLSENYKKHLK